MCCTLLPSLGCNSASDQGHEHGPGRSAAADATFAGEYPIQVVATTGPITDLLQAVGGEYVDVTGLMGPGVDPHLYKALPADMNALGQADLIVYNGLHLEGRMADIFEKLSRKQPVIAVTDGLVTAKDARLRKPPEFEGYYDPHVWHDPVLWSECVKYVVARLQRFDAEHADDYATQAETYLQELATVDQYARERIGAIPEGQRVLVTAHDAFGYFSKAYGLESQALKGISTDEEVSIGRMDDVVEMLVAKKIPAVFVESAVAPRIVEALVEPAAKRGHTVAIGGELYADALGEKDSGADSYLGMFRANVDTIVGALNPDVTDVEEK
jgi:manganese/zinc/iron transport system substrate-binding protein